MNQEWWRDLRNHFGELSENNSQLTDRKDIQPAIDFISTVLPPNARVLDLCCGPGRYTLELAHEGFEVVGFDLSEHYLDLARDLARKEGVTAKLIQGDMRELPWANHFDAVINVSTSFGFFESDAENQRVLEAVAKVLKPEGVFLLELGNRDYYLKHFIAKNWQRLDDGSVLLVQREFDYLKSRINSSFEKWHGGEAEKWSQSWRAYTLAELVNMLEQAGLTLTNVFGGWNQKPYNVDASRMVIVSQKNKTA